MRESSREGDYYRGGPGPDANLVGGPSDCTPPPRRSGQLADYYPLIAQAVQRLEPNTAETRQTIYGRARAGTGGHGRAAAQPDALSPRINHQPRAVGTLRGRWKVETESLRCSPIPLRPSGRQPNAPPGPIQEAGDEQAKRLRPSTDEDHASDDLTFARRLAMDKPDLAAELETLQKEIRRDRRGSLMILPARKLVPLTIVGLLVGCGVRRVLRRPAIMSKLAASRGSGPSRIGRMDWGHRGHISRPVRRHRGHLSDFRGGTWALTVRSTLRKCPSVSIAMPVI
jgi:hypothetical protein